MTPGQTRVLALLGVLLGMEVLFNPTFRGNLVKGASGKLDYHTMAAGYIGWGAGVVALVALAAPAPKVATWIVVIFIFLALITHADVWSGALKTASDQLTALTTVPQNNGGSAHGGKGGVR